MKYKKPKIVRVNAKEKVQMASGKRECDEWGCCVKALRNA